ncbi:MAG: lipopolysaccharide export system permease protein [Verrucomicrobiota bacterium]|nr:lipopolysaccharide export system permease protein [Verrucomicrobiota bacterium]MEA3205487.1 lipopolysaccharide export system permease protein [Verrucomicrobiota bacterium]
MFRIFDRYLIKNFLVPFFYSLFGMLAIWLVYDLGEHANDFQEAHLGFQPIAQFYLAQIPFIVVNQLPLSVLLGLLYVLTRMSRRNEIVSMLGAGVSVPRLLLPLILLGMLLTAGLTVLNYELGPKGQWASAYMLDEIIKGKSKNARMDALVFPNRRDFRIWFVQLLDAKNEQLKNVQVVQQDGHGVIQSKVYGQNATYDGSRKVWIFYNGKTANFDTEGNVSSEEFFTQKEVSGWSETPWRLSSATLKGKYMTVPQLEHYLNENGDFPESNLAEFKTQMWYRFALPWNVLVVVFVASPLCIAFSRRGALGGIAGGLFLFIGLFSSSNVFLALGQGSRISPLVAAWTPAATFLFLGFILLYRRATNRPIPFTG